MSWRVRRQRLDEARRLLESTDLPIDQVAAACGSGSTVTMRQGFAAAFHTSPTEYRRRFDARAGAGGAGRRDRQRPAEPWRGQREGTPEQRRPR